MADESGEFPFTKPEGSDVEMFIQWKGTNVCLDFHCSCGYSSHIDDDFTYFIRCLGCDAVYEMGTQVIAKRNDSVEARQRSKTGECHDHCFHFHEDHEDCCDCGMEWGIR